MLKSLWCVSLIGLGGYILQEWATAQPSITNLDKRWAELASPNEGQASLAMLALASSPKETIAFLKERLKPVQIDANKDVVSPEIIAVWEKAGTELGWLQWGKFEWLEYSIDRPDSQDPVPAFRVHPWTAGMLIKLPAPTVPFGLYIYNTSLKDDDLHELAAFKELATLDISNSKITDDGLRHLIPLKKLQSLNLYGTKIRGAGLKHLAGLTELHSLGLKGSDVFEGDFKELSALRQLRRVEVGNYRLTDAGLKEIGNLHNLETLNIAQASITDKGLKELAALKKLKVLSLREIRITDDGINHLLALVDLRGLDLGHTGISDSGLMKVASSHSRA
jgi:Leucine-rich repeat (LRR) protein